MDFRHVRNEAGLAGIRTRPPGFAWIVTRVIVLIVALAAAAAVGAVVRLRAGKVRSFPGTDSGASPGPSPSVELLTADDLGASLGERATLVQFSTEFCAFCGPTRELLTEMAGERPGVAMVEIDAAERMDLTRRLRVFSTPTVLVLRPDGTIAARSAGMPEKAALAESLGSVLHEGVRS
jgi:thiol-disulfide isomerase/thioredoxin